MPSHHQPLRAGPRELREPPADAPAWQKSKTGMSAGEGSKGAAHFCRGDLGGLLPARRRANAAFSHLRSTSAKPTAWAPKPREVKIEKRKTTATHRRPLARSKLPAGRFKEARRAPGPSSLAAGACAKRRPLGAALLWALCGASFSGGAMAWLASARAGRPLGATSVSPARRASKRAVPAVSASFKKSVWPEFRNKSSQFRSKGFKVFGVGSQRTDHSQALKRTVELQQLRGQHLRRLHTTRTTTVVANTCTTNQQHHRDRRRTVMA